MLSDYGRELEEQKSWYDTAQICPNGHVINYASTSSPESNKKFCDKCGEATITACQNCNTPVQGILHVPNMLSISTYGPPRFCHECGKNFPWTKKRLDVARELIDELNLSDEEKDDAEQSITDLVQDSPRSQVAAAKFKRLVAKGGAWSIGVFRDILVDVLSETAKKLLFPQQ